MDALCAQGPAAAFYLAQGGTLAALWIAGISPCFPRLVLRDDTITFDCGLLGVQWLSSRYVGSRFDCAAINAISARRQLSNVESPRLFDGVHSVVAGLAF